MRNLAVQSSGASLAHTISESHANQARNLLHRVSRIFQDLLAPGLKHSQEKYRELLEEKVALRADWLDIGCGHELLPDWVNRSVDAQLELVSRSRLAVGVDCGDDRPHVALDAKYHANIEDLPFAAASFSLVTANMVVEHLAHPELALREIHRVLRPGGYFLFHTPNAHSPFVQLASLIPSSVCSHIASYLDGRHEVDIFPTHYFLNDPESIKSTAEAVGFSVSRIEMVETAPVLTMLGPIAFFELLAIRLLRFSWLADLRPDLLAVLRKPDKPLSMKGHKKRIVGLHTVRRMNPPIPA
jgi:SAM-dependent methyltransferase